MHNGLTLLFMTNCSNPKTNNINEASVDFVLNDCEVTYKGKVLPMGKPAEEWIKIFGKPSRILTNPAIKSKLRKVVAIYLNLSKGKSTPYKSRSILKILS